MNWKTQNKREFYSKKSNLDSRVKKHFLEDDKAILPCRITDYYDVISKYSMSGYETLNPEFVGYITDVVRFIPAEYKLVIRFSGAKLTEDEKASIKATLREDAMYELGAVEEEKKELRKSLILNIIGLILLGTFLTVVDKLTGMPREFLYIFFWFFADVVISYILYGKRNIVNKHILAGRMASIEVEIKE